MPRKKVSIQEPESENIKVSVSKKTKSTKTPRKSKKQKEQQEQEQIQEQEQVVNKYELDLEQEILYKFSDQIPKHPRRLHVYKKFFSLFIEFDQQNIDIGIDIDFDKLQAMALNIEKSIFNYTLINNVSCNNRIWNDNFQTRYIMHSVRIYTNLNPNSYLKNTNLIKRLFDNEFKEYEIVLFSPEQLFPERHKELVDSIIAKQPKMAPKLEITNDGMHKCGKCKMNKTTHYQMMTRACDEPITTFVRCHVCNIQWKY